MNYDFKITEFAECIYWTASDLLVIFMFVFSCAKFTLCTFLGMPD